MPKWLLYSILAVLSWGVWGVLSKVAADAVPPFQNQVLSTLGLLAPAALAALVWSFRGKTTEPGKRGGWWLAFGSGMTGALGNLALFASLSAGGQAAVVSPLTAVYPLLTILAAWWWLGEELQWVQWVGVGLALAAMVLFNVQEAGMMASQNKSWSNWMPMALLATVLFGATGFLQKLATNRVSAEASFVTFAAGFLPIAVTVLLMPRLEWNFPVRGGLWATLGGTLNGLGVLATLAAYRLGGKASVVTPLAALYPVVTVLLAVGLLRERVGLKQTLAIALAVMAGIALSWERSSVATTPEQR